MIRKLIWNDYKQNKLLSVVTTVFMAVSAMLLALTALLISGLLGAMDDLMERAKTPDFLQMHTGEINREEIREFAEAHVEIKEWQVSGFLNLENSTISLGGKSLADSTQDNGLCVQGEKFDYLLDLDNQLPEVAPGEVYVPAAYHTLYDVKVGDIMQVGLCEQIGTGTQIDTGTATGGCSLQVAGFVRDSQMNSMMSSSKRFLVNEADYEKIKAQEEEEYLIEFLLTEGTDPGVVNTAYAMEGLPANGPTITKPLIRMMNALSDGMMILVIFLVSIVVLFISILCIRFILALRMEQERKEAGMLKALGIGKREIRKLYFAKYMLLSVCGALTGLLAAYLLQRPLVKQMQELYGVSGNGWQTGMVTVLAAAFSEAMILLSIWRGLRKVEKLSALDALFPEQKEEKKKGFAQYMFIGFVAAAGTFLMLVPQNLYSTLSSPDFVTYMGIGDGEIRIDVRQTEDIQQTTRQVIAKLEQDERVEKYTVLQTQNYQAFLTDGTKCNLTVEVGNHTIFPVSYVMGRAPKQETELALSTLNAEELGLKVGDSLQLQTGESKISYSICGIYSDITNGGKTAKAGMAENNGNHIQEDTPVMWSILYVSLKSNVLGEKGSETGASKKQWLETYNGDGVKAVDIADYVAETYGQTLQEIKLASGVAKGTAVGIIFVVIALFMRLILEKNRYAVSLQKALGFSNKSIQRAYMIKGLLSVTAGIVAGLLLGGVLGEGLCGMILKSFGAEGFRFVPAWDKVLLLIPAISLFTAGAAVRIGIQESKEVKAYECCRRKE